MIRKIESFLDAKTISKDKQDRFQLILCENTLTRQFLTMG